jgi:Ribbon-helix-helix protein, copG family
MTLSIQLSDEEAAALRAKAAAEGLTLEEWIRRLAGRGPEPSSHLHIADAILENMRDVPPEIMGSMPEDGASQHDHYIYGWPKKEE